MLIKDMFEKDIARDIDGVIKASQDEETKIAQELEEYVVTRELQKYFATFFSAYKKGIVGTTDKMGVWISGFFGSGKSHMLKIIAYLLENREINGKHAVEYFEKDNKIVDQMVLSDMKLAGNTPTDVILFNIDSKSDSNGKQNENAIVNVFLKVFNEMQGFSGSNMHLADLEKNLEEKGKYDEFKKTFEMEYGDKWEDSRQDFSFIQDDIVSALSKIGFMTEESAKNWCEKANEEYKISIEDFAKRVKKYIDKKGNNHHVVFLVDEIGQYIAEDTKLTLNLQTVTEELGVNCEGKAWVIVTSQQNIDDITRVKGDDFSKIQGRFNTRIALSSANVDEVIEKRILAKKEPARESLKVIYEQTSTVIKNLIMFKGTKEQKLYANDDDFANIYPFVRYQFNLLASILTSIRMHGASGKHLSEGERSMLALFKESAMKIRNEETGRLVPLYLFYDALEDFLDHSHRSVIIKAYDNTIINPEKKSEDVFAINVLKTLFMIKYVDEIEKSVDDITSLMIQKIDDDRIELKEKVEQSLKILTSQMLVQQNGDKYVFLTDEEQEITREINSQHIEEAETIKQVSELIFEDIFTEKKYKVPDFNGRYTFYFNQIVDDRPYKNQNYDMTVRIITPWYNQSTEESNLRMLSGQGNEVVIALPIYDKTFLTEIETALKISKFLRMANANNTLSKFEEIKSAKQAEIKERQANAKLYLEEALREATIYVNGDIVNISSKDPTTRITEALSKLMQNVYHKLNYIDTPRGEEHILKLLKDNNQTQMALDANAEPNPNAQREVLDFIMVKSQMHGLTSIKSIKEQFTKAPYGFIDDDINYIVARLFRKGDISLVLNGETITQLNKTPDDIFNYITKKQYVEKLLLKERTRVPENEKLAVRKVSKEVFGISSPLDDEDTLIKDFKDCSNKLLRELETIENTFSTMEKINSEAYSYPGKKVIQNGKKLILKVTQEANSEGFFRKVCELQDDFLDFSEDYEPVKTFFGGEQQKIFEKAIDCLSIYDASKTYIVNEELEKIVNEMKQIVKKENPYFDIPKLPELRENFITAYTALFENAKKPIIEAVQTARDRVFEILNQKEYKDSKKSEYISKFDEINKKIEDCNNLAKLKSFDIEANALKMRLIDEMTKLDQSLNTQNLSDSEERCDNTNVKTPSKRIKNLAIRDITLSYSWRIETESDVMNYIEDLKQKLLKELNENEVINIEF